MWRKGKLTDLLSGCGADEWGWARAINEKGEIVGGYQASDGEHAFVWRAGRITELPTLDGVSGDSEARAINEHEQIVGTAASRTHLVLWTRP